MYLVFLKPYQHWVPRAAASLMLSIHLSKEPQMHSKVLHNSVVCFTKGVVVDLNVNVNDSKRLKQNQFQPAGPPFTSLSRMKLVWQSALLKGTSRIRTHDLLMDSPTLYHWVLYSTDHFASLPIVTLLPQHSCSVLWRQNKFFRIHKFGSFTSK